MHRLVAASCSTHPWLCADRRLRCCPQIIIGALTPDSGEVIKAKEDMRIAYLTQVRLAGAGDVGACRVLALLFVAVLLRRDGTGLLADAHHAAACWPVVA